MNEEVRKAVEYIGANAFDLGGRPFRSACLNLIDHMDAQDAELSTHRANYDALVIRLGEVTTRLEAANGLLRKCDAVARDRGDKYGLCDAIDNSEQPYQSQFLADHLATTYE